MVGCWFVVLLLLGLRASAEQQSRLRPACRGTCVRSDADRRDNLGRTKLSDQATASLLRGALSISRTFSCRLLLLASRDDWRRRLRPAVRWAKGATGASGRERPCRSDAVRAAASSIMARSRRPSGAPSDDRTPWSLAESGPTGPA